MLDYENQIFLDILNEDALVVTAKGIGVESVFLNLLKVYSDPGNLVLVLGTTPQEDRYFVSRLEQQGVIPLPRVITSESGSSAERKDVYLEGGIMFVSPRILVVDLLKDRLPVPHITGIVVYRAQSIVKSCQEAFAIRLYRQKNKTGFVKAFSSSPQALTVGFAQVARIMRMLFVKKLFLWPRFQAIVQTSLGTFKPIVIEMQVNLTPAMTRIQNAVLDLMSFTVKELKRINPAMDFDELTVENAIAKSFHKILQLQLDTVWHQLSSKTKALVADLKVFRVILAYLIRYDCVTFHSFVSTFRTRSYALNGTGWLLLEAADVVFSVSKERVLGVPPKPKVEAAPRRGPAESPDKPGPSKKVRRQILPSDAEMEVAAEEKEVVFKLPARVSKLSLSQKPRSNQSPGLELPANPKKGARKPLHRVLEDSDPEDVDAELEEKMEEEEVGKPQAEAGINPEPNPKWAVLKQILSEIKETCKTTTEGSSSTVRDKVLILVEDKHTAKQLQECLILGAREMLLKLHRKSCETKTAGNPPGRGYDEDNTRSPTRLFRRYQTPMTEGLEVELSTQMVSERGDGATEPDREDVSDARGSHGKGTEARSSSEKETKKQRLSKKGAKKQKLSKKGAKKLRSEKGTEMQSLSEDETEISPEKGTESPNRVDGRDGMEETAEDAAKDEPYSEVYVLSQKPTASDGLDENEPNSKGNEEAYEVIANQTKQLDETETSHRFSRSPLLVIQTFKTNSDPLSLPQTLEDLKPRFIVLYDVDISVIRRIEVYQGLNPRVNVRVYFVVYGGSVEEQAYLTSLRREKEAFEYLIREKATMVIPEDQDGKSDLCEALSRDASKPNEVVNTRRGGPSREEPTPARRSTVVVDMREFNSELPAMIHRRGIDVEPVTLQVGDYILSPDICVERKSVNDLIGSLNHGRLYNQAKAMTRYYATPILLIEFDQNKPMTLQGNYYISNDMSSNDVSSKLILLTLHFPQLRIVWSPSPSATAQLFEELKQVREEPDAIKAAEIGADLEQDLDIAERYSPAIHDLVARLPGVTSKNIHALMNRGVSLDRLVALSKEELTTMLNNSQEGESLYDAFHEKFKAVDMTEASSKRGGARWRGRGRGFRR